MPDEVVAATPEPQISLADHEAQFAPPNSFSEAVARAAETPPVEAPPAPEDEGDEPPVAAEAPRRGHKAASQVATADDLEQISALTKRVRDAEKELGIERKPGESSRVFNLRKQAEMAERLRATPAPAVTPAIPPAPVAPPPAVSAPSAFSEAKPLQAQFMNEPDPYAAWVSATARWEWRKEQFDAHQTTAKTQQEQESKARQEKFSGWVKSVEETHAARSQAFFGQNAAAKAELEGAAMRELSPIMYGAVTLSERGPEIMLEYARHPELVDELLLQTAGRSLIQPDGSVNPLVAVVQRRVLSRVAVAVTGSTPPRVIVPAPRPPNPVRTAPSTPSATPPGENATLAEHEKFYGPKRSH